jgi:hypothetical protein
MDPSNLAVVALRPRPHVVAGHLSAADLRAVTAWIAWNHAAILDHWNELIDGASSWRGCGSCREPAALNNADLHFLAITEQAG